MRTHFGEKRILNGPINKGEALTSGVDFTLIGGVMFYDFAPYYRQTSVGRCGAWEGSRRGHVKRKFQSPHVAWFDPRGFLSYSLS